MLVSPQTITSTASIIASSNRKRKFIHIQNTGEELVYFKKQPINLPAINPSTTNYDFILYPSTSQSAASKISGITDIWIESIASIRAFSPKDSTIAVMEVVYLDTGSSC